MPADTAIAGPLAGLPHIDSLLPRSADDEACFTELREVLARHGKLDRFGVTLLHHHFAVGTDEVLVEECDVEGRTLVTRPRKLGALGATPAIETNWRLDVKGVIAACTQVCTYDDDHNHIRSTHL